MNKILFPTLVLALAASNVGAEIHVSEETPLLSEPGKATLLRSARIKLTANDSGVSTNTFFEGFEDRPEGLGDYYDEWLPDGWQDISKSGQTVPEYGDYRHNLTWRVMSNDGRTNSPTCSNYAYEGENFAFIMADVAYGDYVDLKNQDEWLITPEVTPKSEDWLYFQIYFSAPWTVYNRTNNDFTGQNNSMEIYVTTDDGNNWEKIWSLIDDEIRPNWTDEQLRSGLTGDTQQDFTPIYVNLEKYVGKTVKVAFRYFGRLGHPIAIDNVAIGVPQPIASYTLPAGFLRQGLSPYVEYPANPTLLAPFGTEATWVNTSESILSSEWTYAEANGDMTTSNVKNLITPAYPYGSTVATPSLVGIFESRRSEPFTQNHKLMQAGGSLYGQDTEGYECEFSVGHYDIADPYHTIGMTQDLISFHPDLNLIWETRLGVMPSTIDIAGFCNLYYASPSEYGFDFVDVAAIVTDAPQADSEMIMTVYLLDDLGQPSDFVGMSVLKGSDIPVSNNPVNIRFKFDVPVYIPAGRDYITLLTHSDRESDTIILLYVKTPTSSITGNSLVYLWSYDSTYEYWYDTFFNLNNFTFSGSHFAGLCQSVGATYSSMKLIGSDNEIKAPMQGTTKEFTIQTEQPADRIAVTEDGRTKPEWANCTITPGTDGTHTVKIEVAPADTSEDIETQLYITAPGSRVAINVSREGDPAGIVNVNTAKTFVSVTSDANAITVKGASDLIEVINISGAIIASVSATEGSTIIPAATLTKGVYLIRANGKSYKIIR